MPTIAQIRLANLLALIQQFGSIQKLADKVGKAHSQLSQLRNEMVHSKTGNPRTIGTKLAREIEAKVGKPLGWMDQLHPETELRAGAEPTDKRGQLALRLLTTRQAKRMARTDAAAAAGITDAELATIESGGSEPSIWVMGELALLYGYTVDALLWDNALSPEAMRIAAEFDNLPAAQQAAIRTTLLAFGRSASDDDVAAAIHRGTGPVQNGDVPLTKRVSAGVPGKTHD